MNKFTMQTRTPEIGSKVWKNPSTGKKPLHRGKTQKLLFL